MHALPTACLLVTFLESHWEIVRAIDVSAAAGITRAVFHCVMCLPAFIMVYILHMSGVASSESFEMAGPVAQLPFNLSDLGAYSSCFGI